jgi:hypothetical protein
MPLSTRLLAEFITYRSALGIYWLNVFVPGAMLYFSWVHATRADLIKADAPPEFRDSICRRILIAQLLYAAGAALCFVSTYVSNCACPVELCDRPGVGQEKTLRGQGKCALLVPCYFRLALQNELTLKYKNTSISPPATRNF